VYAQPVSTEQFSTYKGPFFAKVSGIFEHLKQSGYDWRR
jgi:hypothetical protein